MALSWFLTYVWQTVICASQMLKSIHKLPIWNGFFCQDESNADSVDINFLTNSPSEEEWGLSVRKLMSPKNEDDCTELLVQQVCDAWKHETSCTHASQLACACGIEPLSSKHTEFFRYVMYQAVTHAQRYTWYFPGCQAYCIVTWQLCSIGSLITASNTQYALYI